VQKKVSAVFSAGTSPDQVLSSLGYVHQFSFIKKEHQTYIVGK
jgi:hypothetical protein